MEVLTEEEEEKEGKLVVCTFASPVYALKSFGRTE